MDGNNNFINEDLLTNDSFVEELHTAPESISEKYDNVIDVEQTILEKTVSDAYVDTFYITETGEKKDMDYEATLTKMTFQESINRSKEPSTFYVLSVTSTTKTSTDTITSHGVTLNGCIGWVDNVGLGNEFKYVSGSRSGSYTGDGYYNAKKGTVPLCAGYFNTSFYSTSTVQAQTGSQFQLLVRSQTTSGNKAELLFSNSIFD